MAINPEIPQAVLIRCGPEIRRVSRGQEPERSETDLAYLVNTDRAHSAVVIHRTDCQWIREGAQQMVPEEWHGPVATVQEALAMAH